MSRLTVLSLLLVVACAGSVQGQTDSRAFFCSPFDEVLVSPNSTPVLSDSDLLVRGQEGEAGGGSGGLAGQATNPTADLTIYQLQNTFVPSTYEASGFAHILGLQAVIPFKTGNCFFPTWVTRSTLPVVTTADPDASVPIGPPNGSEFLLPLNNESGLGDFVFISILNHPTCWGSWGIGPGFVAPSATRRELGEQSWKFSPTFVVVNTAIPTWQLGILGIHNFPLDGKGTQTLQFQPLIVKQLGEGWYTGWGDDLWQFNTESGNFDMPLQSAVGQSPQDRATQLQHLCHRSLHAGRTSQGAGSGMGHQVEHFVVGPWQLMSALALPLLPAICVQMTFSSGKPDDDFLAQSPSPCSSLYSQLRWSRPYKGRLGPLRSLSDLKRQLGNTGLVYFDIVPRNAGERCAVLGDVWRRMWFRWMLL